MMESAQGCGSFGAASLRRIGVVAGSLALFVEAPVVLPIAAGAQCSQLELGVQYLLIQAAEWMDKAFVVMDNAVLDLKRPLI